MHKFCALLGITLMLSASTLAIANEKTSSSKTEKISGLVVPEMVDIPAGSFMMGNINNFVPKDSQRAKATEKEGWILATDFEQPVHKVNIKAFRMGKYEVTFEQYDVFAEATGKAKPDDQGNGRGQQPVGNVTWGEAVAYAEWLSQQTGKKFRLPSEAEWQYAARAGTTTEYYWGNEPDRNFANYGKDESSGLHASGADKWLHAAPVGQFRPNQFGLYDMLGNVNEFAQDCWNPNYIGAPTDGSAWATGNCSQPVTLGGQYHIHPFWLRSAARIGHPSKDADRMINFGFRIAQDIE